MSQLIERTIQEIALEYLTRYYRKASSNGRVWSGDEVWTKEGDRADGVIAWKQGKNKLNVAALEAKSHKTLTQLTAKVDSIQVERDSKWLSGLMYVIAFGFWYKFSDWRVTYEPLYPLLQFLLLFLLAHFLVRLLKQFYFYKSIAALRQLGKYPSNEGWIAIGIDSIKDQAKFSLLKSKCRQKGIGLLVVSTDGRVSVQSVAKYRPSPPGKDAVSSYICDTEIREALKKEGFSFGFLKRTRGQRMLSRSSLAKAATLVAVMFFISLYLPNQGKNTSERELTDFPTVSDGNERNKVLKNNIISFPKGTVETSGHNTSQEESEKTIIPLPDCTVKLPGTHYVIFYNAVATESEAQKTVEVLKNAGFEESWYFWLPCFISDMDKEAFAVVLRPARQTNDEAIQDLVFFAQNAPESEEFKRTRRILKIVSR